MSLPKLVVAPALKCVATKPDRKEALRLLPTELQRVARLPQLLRYCFVLRLLLGMSPEDCSQLLQISVNEVDDAFVRALLALAFESMEQATSDVFVT
jgi:DNA-directed RNA polymerase specialized sigma24 family protein